MWSLHLLCVLVHLLFFVSNIILKRVDMLITYNNYANKYILFLCNGSARGRAFLFEERYTYICKLYLQLWDVLDNHTESFAELIDLTLEQALRYCFQQEYRGMIYYVL